MYIYTYTQRPQLLYDFVPMHTLFGRGDFNAINTQGRCLIQKRFGEFVRSRILSCKMPNAISILIL